MPRLYDQNEIVFAYPENWELDESEAASGDYSVTVYGPGGSFWMISRRTADNTPEKLLDIAIESLREEYKNIDVEVSSEDIDGTDVRVREVNFFYLDLTMTAFARSYETAEATYLIYCQADDRELDKVQPVFNAMTHSALHPEKTRFVL